MTSWGPIRPRNFVLSLHSLHRALFIPKTSARENRAQTTAAALTRGPCSFCNHNERVTVLKIWNTFELNITLLENTIAQLRVILNQPKLQSHALYMAPVLLKRRFKHPKYHTHLCEFAGIIKTCISFTLTHDRIYALRKDESKFGKTILFHIH